MTESTHTRQQIQRKLLEWFKQHPDESVTLDELERELNAIRSSISGAITKFVGAGTLPGLERLGGGIYRYNSSNGSTPSVTTTTDDAPQRYTLVGRIGAKAIVIVDSDGNLWRAERLS